MTGPAVNHAKQIPRPPWTVPSWPNHWQDRVRLLAIRKIYGLLAWVTGGWMPPIVGVACVVECNGKVLAIERQDGLGYSLPGGVIRSDETVEEALHREVQEETGCEIAVAGLVGVFSGPHRDPRFNSASIVYAATVVGGLLRNSREGRACWLDPQDVPSRLAFDEIEVLREYQRMRSRQATVELTSAEAILVQPG